MGTLIFHSYQVRDDDIIKLKVTIGDAQRGVTTVKLGVDELANNHPGQLELTIGSGRDLKGKELFCTTTVADVRTETNHTSVTFEVEGGPNSFSETLQKTVKDHGDVVFYVATFSFFG